MADLIKIVEDNQKPGMVVAEIGCWDGGTTQNYVEIIKRNNGKLIVVDWFCGSHGVNGLHAYQPGNHDQIYNEFVRKINAKGCMDITTIYKETSIYAVTKIPDRSIDIVYIDADHRYSAVKTDILIWISKVKNDGLLCGHDYDNCPQYLNKFSQEQLESDVAGAPWSNAHAGVLQAVHDCFGSDFETYNISWIKRINHINKENIIKKINENVLLKNIQIDLKDGRRIWVPSQGRPFWIYPYHKIELTNQEIKEYIE